MFKVVPVSSPWDNLAVPDTRVDNRNVINDPINWKLASTYIWFWTRYTHLPKLNSLGEKIHPIKINYDTDDGLYD